MILLDTNVLSECFRPQPDSAVLYWLSRQPRASLFTATMVEAELLYGVQLLPESERKVQLLQAVQAIFNEDFAGRVLSFDREAAQAYAVIASVRKKASKPISQIDAMIASVAQTRGATLATRNTKDFVDCGLVLVNPWNE